MADSLQMRYRDGSLTLATLGSLVVTTVTGPTTLPQAKRLRALVNEIQRGLGGVKTCGVTLMRMAAGEVQMEPEVRKELTAMMEETREQTAATAMAFEGNNLLTMALRAAVSVLLVASRSKFPSKVCATADEAITWLVDYMQPGLDAEGRLHCKRAVLDLYAQAKVAADQRSA